MKTMQIRWTGLTPLLMHSAVGVNPTHPLTIACGKITKKRNKTEDDQIELLNERYADIIASGRIERTVASDAEIADDDALTLHRLQFRFTNDSYARLHALIRTINTF